MGKSIQESTPMLGTDEQTPKAYTPPGPANTHCISSDTPWYASHFNAQVVML